MRHEHPARIVLCLGLLLAGTASAQSPIEGLLQNVSLTPPQQSVGRVIEIICPRGGLNADLQARCDEVVLSTAVGARDVPGSTAGLQAMAPEEDHVVGATQSDLSAGDIDLAARRVELARSATANRSTLTVNGRQVALAETNGMAAGNGFGRWNTYLDIAYALSDRDATARQSGFDADTWSLLGGLEYDYSTSTFAGIAIGYTRTDADLDANGGDVESDEVQAQLYGSHYIGDRLRLDGTLGYAHSGIDQSRAVRYSILNAAGNATTFVDQLALSDTNSRTLWASVQLGYDMQQGEWAVMPFARLEVAKIDIDGFTERMSTTNAPGAGLATQIDDQSITSIPLSVGVQASRWVRTGWGRISPQLAGELVYEFDNEPDDIRGRFVGDPSGTTFILEGDDADSFYARFSAGAAMELGESTTGSLAYQGLVGYRDLSMHAFQLSFQHRW